MPPVLHCPHCQAGLRRPPGLEAGVEVRCPACAEVFAAPAETEEDLPLLEVIEETPPPAAPRERLPVLEVVEDEPPPPEQKPHPARAEKRTTAPTVEPRRSLRRPPPPRKERSSSKGLIVLGVLLLLLVGAVAGVLYVTVRLLPQVARGPDLPEQKLSQVRQATVLIKAETDGEVSSGSGFLIERTGDSGFILTNDHVVNVEAWPPRITVVFDSGTAQEFSVPAEVVFADADEDLAVLRVRDARLPTPLRLNATQPRLYLNQRVWALGFPADEVITRPPHPAVSVSTGWVTDMPRGADGLLAELQITNEIRQGSSGGPLVNSDGEVVGVISAMIDGTDINLAIPRDRIDLVLPGQVLAPTVEAGTMPNGVLRLDVRAPRFDPHSRVTDARLIGVPLSRFGAMPVQHKDGTWTSIQSNSIVAPLRLSAAEAAGEATMVNWVGGQWVFQVRYLSDGQVRFSAPTVHPGLPAPPRPVFPQPVIPGRRPPVRPLPPRFP